MTVIYCTGDIFTVLSPQAIAHGCNCAGAMGKGIAITFREKWPLMYARYKELCSAKRFVLGDVFEWTEGATKIYNLGTQKTWRSKAEISAIKASMEKLSVLLTSSGISEIYMPRIGSGLGGLDWAEVKPIIESIYGESSIRVYICDEFVAGAHLQEKK
ncbi:macro domain-containing protein [Duganella sp. CF458]|uniref:macro domain-containing protein n=1 Tax=Duganella sp. CF458 TaxID=1884368 RepID=UPI000B8271CD|nr:macro domain-containing protein [Duganella sp. CF458]